MSLAFGLQFALSTSGPAQKREYIVEYYVMAI